VGCSSGSLSNPGNELSEDESLASASLTLAMQKMDRHLFKVVSGWKKAPKNHFLNTYYDSLLLSRGKTSADTDELRFSVIYHASDDKWYN
jgi:hypothetical protein